jgi:hypothetical protein
MRCLVLLVCLALPCLGQIEPFGELDAIAAVEGPPPGRAGELTPWHILPATWALYSKVPMNEASPLLQQSVALCILADIQTRLTATGYPINAYTVALRWNAGTHARHFRPRHYEYARAVQTLYVQNQIQNHPAPSQARHSGSRD